MSQAYNQTVNGWIFSWSELYISRITKNWIMLYYNLYWMFKVWGKLHLQMICQLPMMWQFITRFNVHINRCCFIGLKSVMKFNWMEHQKVNLKITILASIDWCIILFIIQRLNSWVEPHSQPTNSNIVFSIAEKPREY